MLWFRYRPSRVGSLFAVTLFCLSISLSSVGCSDDTVVPPEDPASLSEVWFPSSDGGAFDYYSSGDEIRFVLSNSNHSLEVVDGKVCVDGIPVIEFNRIDSTIYEPSVGNYVDYKTPLEQLSSLSEDRRTIKCILPSIPAESRVPGNHHEWYIHLSRATGSTYGDRSGAFFMEE